MDLLRNFDLLQEKRAARSGPKAQPAQGGHGQAIVLPPARNLCALRHSAARNESRYGQGFRREPRYHSPEELPMIKRILCFAALTLAAAFTSAAFAQSPPGNQVVATSHAGVAAVDVGILTAADKETNTMPTMRAKLQVTSVTRHSGCEVLKMNAVCKSSGYPADGSDEDNTYAKFSPQGELSLTVANPALHGKFNPGDKFYVDFTPADPPPQA